jgi:uncharacterized damage-inducible protein DinB
MTRHLAILLATCLAGAGALPGQSGDPLTSEAKQAYTSIKNNLTRMAEKMPEENYSFKPTPDIRSFGELVAHVADAQAMFCSTVTGERKSVSAASKNSKADLVAALKESFAICDAAYNSITDATATQTIELFRAKRTKLGALIFNTTHSNEEYGYMAVYLRLKGVVPPSSEAR